MSGTSAARTSCLIRNVSWQYWQHVRITAGDLEGILRPGPNWASLKQSLCGCGLGVSVFAKFWMQGWWVLWGPAGLGCGKPARVVGLYLHLSHKGAKVLSAEGLRRGGVPLPMCSMALHTLKCLHFPLKWYPFQKKKKKKPARTPETIRRGEQQQRT